MSMTDLLAHQSHPWRAEIPTPEPGSSSHWSFFFELPCFLRLVLQIWTIHRVETHCRDQQGERP